mgnify:CR=1 FL=1
MIRVLAALLAMISPAAALVGGARQADGVHAHALVVIVGSRGTFCTGAAIARDLVLTAAHCVTPGAEYRILEYAPASAPALREIAAIVRHPQFDLRAMLAHRATADVALIKTRAALPDKVRPARLGGALQAIAPGDRFVVAGFGVAVRGDGRTGGVARAAALIATGRPGALQVRLTDPTARGERPGLGACTGDSGAPVFQERAGGLAVIGVVSWSTGPKLTAGCGGLTGVTPIARYRDWIVETAQAMGIALHR